MNIWYIKRMFENGAVCVCGQRGSGKDMLIANVVSRRKNRYISNVDYTHDERYIPFDPSILECGRNSYKNFIEKKVYKYVFPYEDGVDIYLSDCGVYFPSQYCSELNKNYQYIPTFLALSRQVSLSEVHTNCQNLNRVWDKLREQQDTYIYCLKTKVFFGKLVVQKIRIYELAEACEKRVPTYKGLWCIPFTQLWQMQRIRENEYYVQHGRIAEKTLVYLNKSKYDTRIFKEILCNGEEKKN